MNKISASVRILCEDGPREFFRSVVRNVYSIEKMLLYRRVWAPDKNDVQNDNQLRLFIVGREYLPILLENWPREFNKMGRNVDQLEKILIERWDNGTLCFVAERDGAFCGAMWAEQWRWGHEEALGGESQNMFEYVNSFVKLGARGMGVGGRLLCFIGQYMAQQGVGLALSRVREDRPSAIAMFEKCGFERVGYLTSKLIFGQKISSLQKNAILGRK